MNSIYRTAFFYHHELVMTHSEAILNLMELQSRNVLMLVKLCSDIQ